MSRYIVDPQLVTDILDAKSETAARANALIEAHRDDELILAPTSYVALSSAFMGIRSMQDRFLENLGIKVAKTASEKVMDAAYSAWSRYRQDNPGAEGPGIFESLYIGAYALLYDGLLTRQGHLYRKYFETLAVIEP